MCKFYRLKENDLRYIFIASETCVQWPRISLYIYSVYISGRPSFRKCSKCFYIPVPKYSPNAIFHNANINVLRANVTGSNELAQ